MNTFIKQFKETHSYEDVISYLDRIKHMSILVIGETIIDEYQYGHTLGKSGKFPVVSFKNEEKERYNGGILAIWKHLMSFCYAVDTYTYNQVIFKKRYIQENQKLFETYTNDLNYLSGEIPKKSIESYDMVIIADFGHGFLNKSIISEIESKAKFIALNTQNNSGNMGMNTINKYSQWDYASIDENELRLACSNQFEDIKQIIHERFNGTDKLVSVTENKYGSYIYKNKEIIHIPAFAENIVDTVGAGDAYLALTSPLAYLNAPPEIIGFVGNVAGAIACGYPGNKEHVTKKKMEEYIHYLYDKI